MDDGYMQITFLDENYYTCMASYAHTLIKMQGQGFIQRGGAWNSPPEILKLSMVIIDLSQVLTTILSQIVPEAI